MKECGKRNSHTSSKLHTNCLSPNNDRHPLIRLSLHFTTFHSTTLHFTSLHLYSYNKSQQDALFLTFIW